MTLGDMGENKYRYGQEQEHRRWANTPRPLPPCQENVRAEGVQWANASHVRSHFPQNSEGCSYRAYTHPSNIGVNRIPI